MDDYPNITTAARHRDWLACARIMFRQLYLCPTNVQQMIATSTLLQYAKIWNEKHLDWDKITSSKLEYIANQVAEFPKFNSIELDPADAEFENALIEFANGSAGQISHAEHTIHFASSIRSAVLATQIDRWRHDLPAQYMLWKEGRKLSGPTFLDDEGAVAEAENAWSRVDDLFKQFDRPRMRIFERLEQSVRPSEIEQVYNDWEKSIL
jgi:hypothetical protein